MVDRRFIWQPLGDSSLEVQLEQSDVEAFAAIDRVFPGARAETVRVPDRPERPLFRDDSGHRGAA